ncbi:hypothetical protein FRC02_007905 [Tulasnella sp. 418]|nr:hypothetical protein FRC02_007905 [Tulasnella sp. 418]
MPPKRRRNKKRRQGPGGVQQSPTPLETDGSQSNERDPDPVREALADSSPQGATPPIGDTELPQHTSSTQSTQPSNEMGGGGIMNEAPRDREEDVRCEQGDDVRSGSPSQQIHNLGDVDRGRPADAEEPGQDQVNISDDRDSIDVSDLDLTPCITSEENARYNGGYSDVYRGTLTKGTAQKEVAIKVLRIQGPVCLPYDHRLRKKFHKGIRLWKTLDHPNIVPCLGYMIRGGGSRALISPWYPNGNIIGYLQLHPKADRNSLVLDVVSGLEYLHSTETSVAHGDLKGENVLVNIQGRASLCDFGLSHFVEEAMRHTGFTSTSEHHTGTVRFMCPELLEVDGAKKKQGYRYMGPWMFDFTDSYG